ncbi:hypothetical protein [Skermania piniformis]|uniref:Tetratricopeptide repeat protein n=1 Tax=Skermania pinensis TaxID=39122 RepID=A0ABX8S5V6_9ACTN|nr:hypothetical protein [Skermania piniformis]QXQ12621.1 hypothetical protein KV203_11670 [Skermania piniformis]
MTRGVLFVAALVVALAFYFALLGRTAVLLIAAGGPVSVGLGIGVLILPLLGVWVVAATLRAGYTHQRLARRIRSEGRELDVSDLPRRASGRIDRAAADELFQQIKIEWVADPDNWRSSYRLARAYDYAGDRPRARETMRRAVALERLDRP